MSTLPIQPEDDARKTAWDHVAAHERPPRNLAHYTLLARLGSGGQGSVWSAKYTDEAGRERSVALKVAHARANSHGGSVPAPPRALSEERDMLHRGSPSLNPGQVAVCRDTNYAFFEMRLLRSPSNVLDACAGLPWLKVLDRVLGMLNAIQEVHRASILHRDLKPDNIAVEAGAQTDSVDIVVLDFGLAKELTSAASERLITLVGEDAFAGTPEYAAPELLHQGKGVADLRTEVFAAGVIAHEMLTGRRLYPTAGCNDRASRLETAQSFWSREIHPRASDLLTAPWPASQPSVARHPSTDADTAQLHAALRTAIDPVLRCATHEERERRYESVAYFRDDLLRARESFRHGTPRDAHHDSYWQFKLRRDNPYIRASYRTRVENDAALLHGANALVDRNDFVRANRLLDLVSSQGHSTFEYGYTHARANRAITVIRSTTP